MKTRVIFAAVTMSLSLLGSGMRLDPTPLHTDDIEGRVRESYSIADFDDNEFHVYEMDDSFAIYSVREDGSEVFVEGDLDTNSPYFGENSDDCRYLGPGNYFVEHSPGVIEDLTTGETVVLDSSPQAAFIPSDTLSTYPSDADNLPRVQADKEVESAEVSIASEDDASPLSLVVNTLEGFNVITKYRYFTELKEFPMNWFGECGLVGLAILIGYLDVFVHDAMIPDHIMYESNSFNIDDPETIEEMLTPIHTEREKLMDDVTTSFKGGIGTVTNWDVMPGTNYCMRDLLFDKYMHTLFGIRNPQLPGNGGGYPMGPAELHLTFRDYVREMAPSLVGKYDAPWSLTGAAAGARSLIEKDLPALLVLSKYDFRDINGTTVTKGKKDHVVVAYGYKDDKFLVHMGWDPGTKNATRRVISNITFWGYFGVNIKAEHVHSGHVKMDYQGRRVKLCGCGYYQDI